MDRPQGIGVGVTRPVHNDSTDVDTHMEATVTEDEERTGDATTFCTIHTQMMEAAMGGKRHDYDGKIPATYRVKRTYPQGDFHIMFTCGLCLGTLREWATRYDFTIEAEAL